MRLNKRRAELDDKPAIERACQLRRRWHESLNGLMYNDDLAGPGGIHLEIFATNETPTAAIEGALRQGFAQRDVVSHSVTICPPEWLVVES